MPSPRKARIIALLASISLLLGLPLSSFQSLRAQTKTAPSADAVKQKPDYSQEAAVIEDLRTSYRFERDGTGQRDVTFRAKVQSDAGVERLGQLVIGYSSANEKLDMDYVRVRKADGSTVNAAASDIQDLTAPITREAPVYTDLRQKHITVPGLRPGDVLEYRMVWTIHTPLAQNHFWVEHDFIKKSLIILNDELTVNIPAASKVKLKNEPGFAPEIKDENDRRVYHWKHANLKPDSEEQDKDEEEQEEKEEPEEIHPDVQLTTFQSWDEVGQWYASLQKDRILPDEKIKIKAEEIIRGRTTEKDKARALYEFVAKNFRYVSLSLGQGRYQPHAAANVMSNQYGDCKDKHTLLASMLAATGLRAYPVLINSTRKLDLDIPSPGQFDHVISAIPLGNETLWADTTAEIAPAGLLSPSLRNKKALMIPTAGPARLETTPAEPPFLSSEIVTLDGTVDELGKLNAHARMVLRGDSEMYMRFAFRRTPKSNWKTLGYYLGIGVGIEGEVTDIQTSDPADLDKPFEIEFNVAKNDFLDWSSKKLKVMVPLPPLNLARFNGRKASSTKPLELGPPIDITYNLKLALPAKYQTRLPLPLKVSRDYVEYVADYKLDGTSLLSQRTLHLRQREIPAERLQDYLAFVAAVKSDEAQSLSLETEIAGTPAISDSVKVVDLIQAGNTAIKNGNYATAEQLFKRAVEKDPKHKKVRNDLAFVMVRQRKFAEAIAVLNEQIKDNPFEDYAYGLLGYAYWQQQDYANAEAAYRKQIEVTPLNASAHSSLGRMLLEARKYKEAIPELERAISLAPEEELLQVNLGRAYLNLDQTDKAIAAFEEAIKLDRTPIVLNNVAYFLSTKSVQLDKALQYAESAVSTIAISLRNLETSSVKIDDLNYVASLASYWDTLGWVYFQKGDLDTAERYIKAAWLQQQHGEIGYHLGIIEEKRGRKQEAIRLYAQASASFRPSREARESLVKLTAPAGIEALLDKAKQELGNYNIIDMGQVVPDLKTSVQAEFYVVVAPDAARNSQVVDVKFIKGDDSLKSVTPALKALKYPLVFPDSTQTKIIRRGALHCVPKPGGCTFTMISPTLITSVD